MTFETFDQSDEETCLHLQTDMKRLKWFIGPQFLGFMGVSDVIFCNAPGLGINAITDLSED